MELRTLRYFLAVVREETISGAAEALHVTQPTLSRQLSELEQRLGKTLFIRGSRKISLTEDGIFLHRRAQEIVDLADKTEADLAVSDEVISGEVSIGGGETHIMRLIAQTVEALVPEYPHVHYHLYSGNAEDVMERLDKGLLDFGLLIGSVDVKKYELLRLPSVDTWGLLARKDSGMAAYPSIRPEDMAGLPLLASSQALLRGELSGWLGDDFRKLNIVATYNLIYNAALMVEEGVGYALSLDKLINTSGDSPLCFIPLEPRLDAPVHFVWKKYQVFSKAAKLFLRQFQQTIRNAAGEDRQ